MRTPKEGFFLDERVFRVFSCHWKHPGERVKHGVQKRKALIDGLHFERGWVLPRGGSSALARSGDKRGKE